MSANARVFQYEMALKESRARVAELEAALKFYADLGPDDIPFADTINDPPDVGRVAREVLIDSKGV